MFTTGRTGRVRALKLPCWRSRFNLHLARVNIRNHACQFTVQLINKLFNRQVAIFYGSLLFQTIMLSYQD
nr:hypothetical protein [Escherichia coli]